MQKFAAVAQVLGVPTVSSNLNSSMNGVDEKAYQVMAADTILHAEMYHGSGGYWEPANRHVAKDNF